MLKPIILIMAGGLGKRMKSEIPKVLHLVLEKPMLVHVIENSFKLNPEKIVIIVGKYRQIIEETLKKYLNQDIINTLEFANQPIATGTGNAVLCGINVLKNNSLNTPVLILSGDTPLVSTNTMKLLLENIENAKIMTTQLENPSGYGRVIINNNKFIEIKEDKDCNSEQLLVKTINTGIYCVKLDLLQKYIPQIDNKNAQNEYYLTDLFSLLVLNNISIQIYNMDKKDQLQLTGINTKEQLEELNNLLLNNNF